MVVAQTSKEALEAIRPAITGRRRVVLNAIKELGEATNETIANYLQWPINRVTGRVTELHEFGYVKSDRSGINNTGHKAKIWSLTDMQDPVEEEKERELDCA